MNTKEVTALRGNVPSTRQLIRNHFSSAAWIEGKALDQLREVSELEGVTSISAFPDLHPGKYGPVGMALEATMLHPLLIGNDIGCGMSLFVLDLQARKLNAEKAADKLRGLEADWNGDAGLRLEETDLDSDMLPSSLGTIGGGNHFCELQTLNETLGVSMLQKDAVYLLVHSGCRGLGEGILASLPEGSSKGLAPDSSSVSDYLEEHDRAVRWASLNRSIIAERAAALLRTDIRLVCDVPHNLVERSGGTFIHRKGAAKAGEGLVPIAGSRATLSYVVTPGPKIADAHYSLSHGAGRKYDRASMLTRVGKTKSDREALTRNRWGGHIVCEDRQLLLEEAPEAYKDAGQVVADLSALGLAEPLASFRPVVTFKRAGSESKENHRQRDKARDIERRKARRVE